MLDGVEQFSSHAYFTLQVNYHTDRLITESDRGGGSGSSSQLYSLTFKPRLCVRVFVEENETSNGKRRNCFVYNNKWFEWSVQKCHLEANVSQYSSFLLLGKHLCSTWQSQFIIVYIKCFAMKNEEIINNITLLSTLV